jgi:hypothetical protein
MPSHWDDTAAPPRHEGARQALGSPLAPMQQLSRSRLEADEALTGESAPRPHHPAARARRTWFTTVFLKGLSMFDLDQRRCGAGARRRRDPSWARVEAHLPPRTVKLGPFHFSLPRHSRSGINLFFFLFFFLFFLVLPCPLPISATPRSALLGIPPSLPVCRRPSFVYPLCLAVLGMAIEDSMRCAGWWSIDGPHRGYYFHGHQFPPS